MDEYYPFYPLPYIDPVADQAIWNQWGAYGDYIVPPDYPGSPSPSPSLSSPQSQSPSYETPYWIDTINRAIERAAQVATIEVGGYPPYPSYPSPQPQTVPMPMPLPVPAPGTVPQGTGSGIQLSQTTLMLLVGGFLLFTLGKRGR